MVFVLSAVVCIKRQPLCCVGRGLAKTPSCSRQPGSPSPLPTNSTGLPGFVRILRTLPRLPPPPSSPPQSIKRRRRLSPPPHSSPVRLSHKQTLFTLRRQE